MSDHDIEILGHQITREVMGDGLDASFLIDTAAALANKGIAAKQASDAQARTTQSDIDAANKAIQADIEAVNACAALEIAQKSAPASVPAKQSAASVATQAQDAAGMGLSPGAMQKRVTAAQAAAKKATDTWSSNPSSVSAAAFAHCWQATVQKASMGGGMPGGAAGGAAGGPVPGGDHGGSFFTRMHAGIPTWGWMAIGVGGIAALGLALKAFTGKKGRR